MNGKVRTTCVSGWPPADAGGSDDGLDRKLDLKFERLPSPLPLALSPLPLALILLDVISVHPRALLRAVASLEQDISLVLASQQVYTSADILV